MTLLTARWQCEASMQEDLNHIASIACLGVSENMSGRGNSDTEERAFPLIVLTSCPLKAGVLELQLSVKLLA